MSEKSAATPASIAAERRLCPNCGVLLTGRYCSHCGQAADLRHRSIWRLAWETIESLFHADGRLWNTLPALFFRPDRLGRDLIEGRIARHVPPFRLFLVALLAFILAGEHFIHEARRGAEHPKAAAAQTGPAKPRAADNVDFGDLFADEAARTARARELRAAAVNAKPVPAATLRRWARALENPNSYWLILFGWAHRLGLLLLPVMAACLTLAYAYRRRFYVYDHLLVAMQFLSFLFLATAIGFLLPGKVGGTWFQLTLLLAPVNLFMTLRGAYRSSIFGAAMKAIAITAVIVATMMTVMFGLLLYSVWEL